ncbi:MAG: SCP2 sterol-binding domain-containing protein [Rudaea sp.]
MPDPRTPNPLLVRLGRGLGAVLDRALALDPQMRAQLAALEGRRIGIELRGSGLALAIVARDGHFEVGPHWSQASNLNVRAAPASLLAFALRRDADAPQPPGKVEISGDADLARRLEKLFRNYRPDVEEAFARAFGDVVGVALARVFVSALAWSRESAVALAQDTAEFLREESRDLIAPAEMEQFLDEVDTLRERGDRLQARVQVLASRARGGVGA